MGYILSIDQGTTGTTAVLIDSETFALVAKENLEYPQIYPKPGWVEHDLNDIWKTVEDTVTSVINNNNILSSQIVSIGITNQRETTCAFRKDGTALSNAIVWQDRRTSEFCSELKAKGLESSIRKITGLPLDPYFSATKMRWLLKNNQDVKVAYEDDNLCFGNIDSFLLYQLTDSSSYKTEASNASRTLLMNLETCEWDKELLSHFEIPKDCLPEICDSFHEFGLTKNLSFLPDGIPITGILGDQQAALFGQAGLNEGDIKCTYGTGAFMLLNTGTNIKYSNSGLLTTVAYKKNNIAYYALEGSSYIAGAAVQWLRDNLSIIKESSDIEDLANEVTDLDDMKHLLFLPFFSGIGSPYWQPEAMAAIVGMTRDTSNSHIAKACLDGICLSINDLIGAMKKDTNVTLSKLKVDGGAVVNNLLMKTQATVSNLEIIRPKVIETTAYGAALASALGNDSISYSQIGELWKIEDSIKPTDKEVTFYSDKVTQWNNIISKLYL